MTRLEKIDKEINNVDVLHITPEEISFIDRNDMPIEIIKRKKYFLDISSPDYVEISRHPEGEFITMKFYEGITCRIGERGGVRLPVMMPIDIKTIECEKEV